MVKGSSRKQKGIQKDLQNNKISHNANQDEESAPFFSAATQEKISKMAKKRYAHTMETTCKWLLIPMELEEGTGLIRQARPWKRLIHYAIATFFCMVMMYKLIVTIQRAASGKLDLITYMCACSFIVVFIPATASVGSTFLPWELRSLLNSWPAMLDVLEGKTGKRISVFDGKALSLEVAILVVVIYSAAINTACYSLVAEIPNCVLPTLKNFGLIDPSPVLPTIVWRLLFLPLEILALLPPMLVVGVGVLTSLLSLEMFNVYGDVARSIPLRRRHHWEEVYMMLPGGAVVIFVLVVLTSTRYRDMQVYSAVVRNWMKVVSVTLPFGACLGIILTLYVTIRPSDIPIIVYPCFPLVAIATMILVTRVLMKARATKLKAEAVIGNLQMTMYSPRIPRFDALERKMCKLRLKSLRPVSMRIGDFAEATLEVTSNIWDGVITQLLFLLTL